MMLAGFFRVMLSLDMMALRHVSMVTGFLVIACFVMLGSRPMVLGSVFVMFGSFEMMLGGLFRHGFVSLRQMIPAYTDSDVTAS